MSYNAPSTSLHPAARCPNPDCDPVEWPPIDRITPTETRTLCGDCGRLLVRTPHLPVGECEGFLDSAGAVNCFHPECRQPAPYIICRHGATPTSPVSRWEVTSSSVHPCGECAGCLDAAQNAVTHARITGSTGADVNMLAHGAMRHGATVRRRP